MVPKQATINLRVGKLGELLPSLAAAGVRIDPKRDAAEYGRFALIWDLERNRVELWEPTPEG
jgi:predicted enzyme related to lactoylglutathione lyase